MLFISPPKLEEKTVPVITEDQMRDLLTLTAPSLARTPAHRFRLVRDRALLYAFWDTPGRLAEIAKLRLDDVDLADGTLLVMGKGQKERRMPIGDAARSVMLDYLQERETLMPRAKALWVSEQGESLLPNGICQILKRLAKRANIEDMHPHRFRHSYAINALRAGMPEQVLKIVGGWKKIPETYFRTLGEEDAREFHRQVSPGDSWGRRRLREGHGGRARGEGGFRTSDPKSLVTLELSIRRGSPPSSFMLPVRSKKSSRRNSHLDATSRLRYDTGPFVPPRNQVVRH